MWTACGPLRRLPCRRQRCVYHCPVDPGLLNSLKALADPSRLRIAGLLATGRRYTVEQLASSLDLASASVAHHLKRLADAELVDVRPAKPGPASVSGAGPAYALRRERLASIGAALHAVELEGREARTDLPSSGATGRSVEDDKVLRAFVVDGRLDHIPAQEKKRLVVLRFLAETDLEADRQYPEKELNAILALRHPDVASLRRYLVDHHFMARDASVYRLCPTDDWQ